VPSALLIFGASFVGALLVFVGWRFRVWGATLGIPLSVAAGFGLHALIERRRPSLQSDLGLLLARSATASDLRRSIAIDLEQLVSACREVDHTIMAKTIGMLVQEYDRAKKSSDRQEALVRAVSLMEKLVEKLEPWYLRHQKAMTWGISVVGSLAGIGKTLLDIIGRSELHH
jgi:hypothetical protein